MMLSRGWLRGLIRGVWIVVAFMSLRAVDMVVPTADLGRIWFRFLWFVVILAVGDGVLGRVCRRIDGRSETAGTAAVGDATDLPSWDRWLGALFALGGILYFVALGRSDELAVFALGMICVPSLFALRMVRSARLRMRARRISFAVCLSIVGAWTPLFVFDPIALIGDPRGSDAPPYVTMVEPQPGRTRIDLRLGFPIAGVRGHYEPVTGVDAPNPFIDTGHGSPSAFLPPDQGLYVLWLDAAFWFLIGWALARAAPSSWMPIAHPYAVVAASFTVVFALRWLDLWCRLFGD